MFHKCWVASNLRSCLGLGFSLTCLSCLASRYYHVQLALFDLDHTLLDGDTDDLWHRFLCQQGVLDDRHYAAQRARYSEEYRHGRLQVADFYHFVLQPLAQNPLQHLLAWRRRFIDECVLPRITRTARALLERHRTAAHTLVIITATNRFITEPIASELGIPQLLATEPEFDGVRFTGRVRGIPCFREGKITHLRAWLQQENLLPQETWFYSDSHNDLPLLENVDHPVAVNADEQLHQIAKQRGWPCLNIRRDPAAAAP